MPLSTVNVFGEQAVLPKGLYLYINGTYQGLDHSGNDADAQSDELWAALFERHYSDKELPSSLRSTVEDILALWALPKPLNPCDPD